MTLRWLCFVATCAGAQISSLANPGQTCSKRASCVGILRNYCGIPGKKLLYFSAKCLISNVWKKKLRASALPGLRFCLHSAHTIVRSSHIILHSFLLLSYPSWSHNYCTAFRWKGKSMRGQPIIRVWFTGIYFRRCQHTTNRNAAQNHQMWLVI